MNILDFFQIQNGIDLEVMRTTFLFSLVISYFVYYKRGFIPGGLIVPGILVLLLATPLKLLLVIGISLAVAITYGVLVRTLAREHIILPDERLLILVLLALSFASLASWFTRIEWETAGLGHLTMVAPALIAERLSERNRWESTKAFLVAVGLTAAFLFLVRIVILPYLPSAYVSFMNGLYSSYHEVEIMPIGWLYFFFGLATFISYILLRVFKIRAVGILASAYLGMIASEPLQLLFVATVVGLAGMMMALFARMLMLAGYRRLVLTALVTGMVYPLVEMLFLVVTPRNFVPFFGLPIAGIMISAIVVNELIRPHRRKVLLGSTVMGGTMALATLAILVIRHIPAFAGFSLFR
ncbi:MAG: hypothetical protein HY459_02265 [Parcubacteria group bacterium]|nr:hypothetical protein [Parcubacteria group bacterium]